MDSLSSVCVCSQITDSLAAIMLIPILHLIVCILLIIRLCTQKKRVSVCAGEPGQSSAAASLVLVTGEKADSATMMVVIFKFKITLCPFLCWLAN